MIKVLDTDPIHVYPPKPTVDELLYTMQSLHGRLLCLEHTAVTPQAAGAFHAASVLVAGVLWPGEGAA